MQRATSTRRRVAWRRTLTRRFSRLPLELEVVLGCLDADPPALADRPTQRNREYECIENNEDILRFEKLLQTEFKN